MTGEITIRVRYAETDRMGLLHHANYLVYFEQGRTELLRSQGAAYRDLEDQGYLLVLTRVQVRYKSPARYDDVLTLRTTVLRTTLVKIEHRYELFRDGVLLAEGETTLGCIDREGKVQALPAFLQPPGEPPQPPGAPPVSTGGLAHPQARQSPGEPPVSTGGLAHPQARPSRLDNP